MRAVMLMAIWAVLAMAVLLAPGCSIVTVASRWKPNLVKLGVGPIVVCSSLIHFLAFFVWYQSSALGTAFTLVVLAISAVVLFQREGRAALAVWAGDRDVRTPIVMAMGMSIAVLGSLLLHGGALHPPDIATGRWVPGLPPDNVLPLLLVERLVNDTPVEPFFAGWLSSDRPPLQAGAFAFVEPLRFGLAFDQLYQVVATVLASFWILGLWTFLRQLRMNQTTCLVVVLTVGASGTIVFNMGYVWPKLLSAALVLIAFSFALPERVEEDIGVGTRWGFCGVAGSLSLLAHGAGMYAIAPVLLVLPIVAVVRRTLPWKQVFYAAGGAVVTMTPWLVYQRLVAPPGDRLLAWHLAGVVEDVPEPWYVSAVDRYREIGWSGAWENRRGNIGLLVDWPNLFADTYGARSWAEVRAGDFYRMGNSVGLAWIGLLLLPLVVLWPRFRPRPLVTVGASLIGSSAWAIIVWCLMAFGPAGTTPHQGTAVVSIFAIGGGSLIVAGIDRRLGYLLALSASIRVLAIWFFASDLRRPETSSSSLVVLLFGLLVMAMAAVDGSGGRLLSWRWLSWRWLSWRGGRGLPTQIE